MEKVDKNLKKKKLREPRESQREHAEGGELSRLRHSRKSIRNE